MDISIRIVLDSRWRVGTGTTRSGLVDDETWADARGHLTIPASHLKRKLREQAEAVGRLLDLPVCDGRLAGADDPEVDVAQGHRKARSCVDNGTPPCLTCRVFGSPRVEPAWRFGPGNLVRPRVSGREEQALKDAVRTRAAHNRVDPWERRVAEDLLFTLEAGRPRLAFTATCTYLLGPKAPEDEVALLVGAVGALESIGGRTRRGYGRCRAWVLDDPRGRTHDQWVDYLIDHRPAVSDAQGVASR